MCLARTCDSQDQCPAAEPANRARQARGRTPMPRNARKHSRFACQLAEVSLDGPPEASSPASTSEEHNEALLVDPSLRLQLGASIPLGLATATRFRERFLEGQPILWTRDQFTGAYRPFWVPRHLAHFFASSHRGRRRRIALECCVRSCVLLASSRQIWNEPGQPTRCANPEAVVPRVRRARYLRDIRCPGGAAYHSACPLLSDAHGVGLLGGSVMTKLRDVMDGTMKASLDSSIISSRNLLEPWWAVPSAVLHLRVGLSAGRRVGASR